jgi:hypothetical protein
MINNQYKLMEVEKVITQIKGVLTTDKIKWEEEILEIMVETTITMDKVVMERIKVDLENMAEITIQTIIITHIIITLTSRFTTQTIFQKEMNFKASFAEIFILENLANSMKNVQGSMHLIYKTK